MSSIFARGELRRCCKSPTRCSCLNASACKLSKLSACPCPGPHPSVLQVLPKLQGQSSAMDWLNQHSALLPSQSLATLQQLVHANDSTRELASSPAAKRPSPALKGKHQQNQADSPPRKLSGSSPQAVSSSDLSAQVQESRDMPSAGVPPGSINSEHAVLPVTTTLNPTAALVAPVPGPPMLATREQMPAAVREASPLAQVCPWR